MGLFVDAVSRDHVRAELRSLSNDSSDRRLSREEKTDEAKKALKRLDTRVLGIRNRVC